MHSVRTLRTLVILFAVAISASAAELERATPESQGMSSEKLALARSFLGEQGTRAALILRHGKVVAEWYWDGSGPDSDFDIASSTKAVFGTAIGLLVDDGKLKLEDPAWKWIPAWRQDGRRDITIFQLANMISGLSGKAPEGLKKDDRDADRLALVLQQPLLYPPGTRYLYNGFAYDCLSTVVRKTTGMEASEFLRQRVFEPIGMQHTTFGFYQGKTEPSGLLHLSARDGARFGYLFLRSGKWNGKQVVSSDWVRRVSRTSNQVNPYCSYLWWVNTPGYSDEKSIPPEIAVNEHGWKDLPRDTFSTFGHYGNAITVIPSQDLVVVRLVGVGKADLSPNQHCKLILDSIGESEPH
jgi:CubicO group peptidase (beta-lactamase class C family)